ncbi:MAG: PadR family transcriptional regulator [Desulfomonile tiedjei]|uniref:PadR family transcriptional regulator n=1 Tax=Desulfomonile tiedjei TaxID=2358 RepID=A0A9D6V3W5_9BACT|nr:PadR family transcriptional regulator [Desulfomonile tiedjei]
MTSHNINASKLKDRNPAEYPILGILARGPAHGYEISLRLNEEIGSIWRLGKSNTYALLGRLERDGLVSHERVGQENLPAKNIFNLTPKGMEVYKEWINKPVWHIRDMRLEFLTKLWCAQQLGHQFERSLISEQLDVCREKTHRLEAQVASCRNEIEFRSLSFRLTMIRATVAWLEGLLERPKANEC